MSKKITLNQFSKALACNAEVMGSAEILSIGVGSNPNHTWDYVIFCNPNTGGPECEIRIPVSFED